jgi:hypothetical protein
MASTAIPGSRKGLNSPDNKWTKVDDELSTIELASESGMSCKTGSTGDVYLNKGKYYIRQYFSSSPDEARPLFVKPNWPLLQKRIFYTVLFSPKFFFAAFFWQAFGYIALSSGHSSTSPAYYLLTGVGTMLGVLLTSFVIIVTTKNEVTRADFASEVHGALLVGLAGGITAGTLWQVSVNIAINGGFDFTGAFFFVYMMSGSSYFLSALLLRHMNSQWLPSKWQFSVAALSPPVVYQELTLAICVGAADAFFVGTDDRVLNYGWLTAFRVSRHTPTMGGMCLAGASAFCGYLICETLLNCVFAEGILWLDEPQPTVAIKVESNVKFIAVDKVGDSARTIELQSAQSPIYENSAL